MKKAYLLGLFLAIIAVPAMGATITANQTAGASYAEGGEFTAIANPPANLGLAYNGGFQTFCIESQVTFGQGSVYNYFLSQTDNTGRSLTMGAAWLFAQFSTGSFSLYNYTFGPNREFSAGALQAALWYFQGQSFNNMSSGSQTFGVAGIDYGLPGNNAFTDAAIAALGGLAAADLPSNGAFGVSIVRLVNPATGLPGQPLLGRNIPDGASTALLLGLALSGLSFISRKIRA